MAGLWWYWDRTHDMPAMVGYLNHWATAAPFLFGRVTISDNRQQWSSDDFMGQIPTTYGVFERERIIGLREVGFSYHAIGARVHQNSSPLMRFWKQWTDEHRTTLKTFSGRRKVTSAHDDQHLLHMAMNDRKASSRQLVYYYRCTNVSFIDSSTSAASWFACIPGVIFQQDNAHPHVAKTVRDFCSAQHMQILLWPAYSPDISPIEHLWDLVDRCVARDPRPAASKDELLLRM
ncbi:hypothetical protein TNCV_1058601 [Trichonephila clavipes]|nr:hypothetical protein TNCV_1058601 [Trichonephila clavipes]